MKNETEVSESNDIFKCEKCVIEYSSKEHLLIHQESHSYGLVCDICALVFNQVDHVRKHNLSFHRDIFLECKPCEYKAKEPRGLRRHIDTYHNGLTFKCEFCGKSYTTKRCPPKN